MSGFSAFDVRPLGLADFRPVGRSDVRSVIPGGPRLPEKSKTGAKLGKNHRVGEKTYICRSKKTNKRNLQ